MTECLWQSKASAALREFSASRPGSSQSEEKICGEGNSPTGQRPGFPQQAPLGHRLFHSSAWPMSGRSCFSYLGVWRSNSESVYFSHVLGTTVPSQTGTEFPAASVNDNNVPLPLFISEWNTPRVFKRSLIWTLPSGNLVSHFQLFIVSPGYYDLSPLAFPNLSVNNSF